MTDKPATLLLVDDDEDFRYQMRVQLEAAGYRVLPADSEAQAESLLKDTVPDLVVLDLMMEHADAGFTLCHRIKKAHPKLPVIIVSGVTHETGIVLEPGTASARSWVKADAFLAKPIRFEQLRAEIERLLEA